MRNITSLGINSAFTVLVLSSLLILNTGCGSDHSSGGEGVAAVDFPMLSFNGNSLTLQINQKLEPIVPDNIGSDVTSCKVEPLLPLGLTLSELDCRISGTPVVLALRQAYIVTANNSRGSATSVIYIQVVERQLAGTLDKNFNGTGQQLTPNFGEVGDSFDTLMLTLTGDIFIGLTGNSSSEFLAFKANGSVNAAPKHNLDLNCTSLIHPICILGDAITLKSGKLLTSYFAGSGYSVFYRLNPNGSLDTSFGTDGAVSIAAPLSSGSGPYRIAEMDNGKIVALLNPEDGASDSQVIRMLANGAPDPDFDGDGEVTISLLTDTTSMAINPATGDVYVVGYETSTFVDESLIHIKPDGSPNMLYGVGGVAEVANFAIYQPDVVFDSENNKVIVSSNAGIMASYGITLVRFLANGDIDTSFGEDGVFTKWVKNYLNDEYASFRVKLEPETGSIMVLGNIGRYPVGPGPFKARYLLTRITSDGILDKNFGVDGFLEGSKDDNMVLESMEFTQDGRLLLGGTGIITDLTFTQTASSAALIMVK